MSAFQNVAFSEKCYSLDLTEWKMFFSSSKSFKAKQERPRQMKKTGGTAAEVLLQLVFQMSLSASFLPRELGRKFEI